MDESKPIIIATGIVLAALVITLGFIYVRSQPPRSVAASTELKTPTPKPVLGWKERSKHGASLDPGAVRIVPIPTEFTGQKLKFKINAESGVNFAVGLAAPGPNNTISTGPLDCSQSEVVLAEQECKISTADERLLLQDTRGLGTVVASAFGFATRNSTMADRGTKPNRVFVTFYEWGCVENCASNIP
jgi:hypothetical protein